MNNLKFDANQIGSAGSGIFILVGFLVLAMVGACRCYDGLGSLREFKRAAGQLCFTVILSAVQLGVSGVWALDSMDGGPSKSGLQFMLFFNLAVIIVQLVFVALAIRNLLAALDQRKR